MENDIEVRASYVAAIFRRMENVAENPFRPEDALFHEVDPIVEAYMKKPYPQSSHGSKGSTPVKSGSQAFVNGKH